MNCWLSKIWTSLLALLVALPIFTVLFAWFLPDAELWAHFREVLLFDLIINTIVLLVGVGVGVMIVGVALAYWVVMVEFPGRRWLEWALFLPFATPAYVLAFVYLGVFDYSGFVQVWLREVFGIAGFDIRGGSLATIITFILAFYPYVYMISRASFKRQKRSPIDAGKVLGASAWRVFWQLSLPLARPAIAAGVLVVMMEVLADFGVVGLFNYDTFTTAIYSAWGDFRSIAVAAQLASILVLIAFLLIYFEKKARGGAKYYSSEISDATIYQPRTFWAWIISIIAFSVFLLAFALPLLQLILWSVEVWAAEWGAKYFDLIVSSLILTVLAVILTVSVATILALPNHCKQGSVLLRYVPRLATLGYALPGSVMAVGLLYFVEQVSKFNQLLGGNSINHLIFGSIALLLFAYVSRFMAIAFNAIDASSTQIKPIHAQNARLLGVSRFRLIVQIYLPILTPSILTASLLVAVDVLKELPATYILRPFGWETLALQVYELSAEGLFERAAIPALIMITIAIILMQILKFLDQKLITPST